ncbi:hypothetical protein NUW58_g4536 [Xylaria curta]|uniref:Uncharacterized protein n=1 Tax=Xylaria curta TaxID=42375 RepID=A0ACC1P7G7_9PEZI|nr:hypothetical protein NUW58_g4536 [Xylaria curta]
MASLIVSDGPSVLVLNEKYDQECSFTLFPLLPWEIRNLVWKNALQRRRLIQVSLKEDQPDGLTEQESSSIKYGRPSLYVNGFQLLSKLLRVNAEARNAALEFYRMRLPCVLMQPGKGGPRMRVDIFPFNPEYDILYFDAFLHFPDFVSAIIMHDSRRVGLCNIAISLSNVRSLQADDPNLYQRPTFIETASNLREFYLMTATSSFEVKAVKERYTDGDESESPYYPLMSGIPAFDILPHDPRPIGCELDRLFLGFNDIPQEISDWKLLLDEWGVDRSQLESRILCIYRNDNPCLPTVDEPYDEPDLQRSRAPGTNRTLHEGSSPQAPTICLTVEGQAQEGKHSTAVGFWMFPLEAFTQANRSIHQQTIHTWDLSNHWPELGLVHLPSGSS